MCGIDEELHLGFLKFFALVATVGKKCSPKYGDTHYYIYNVCSGRGIPRVFYDKSYCLYSPRRYTVAHCPYLKIVFSRHHPVEIDGIGALWDGCPFLFLVEAVFEGDVFHVSIVEE